MITGHKFLSHTYHIRHTNGANAVLGNKKCVIEQTFHLLGGIGGEQKNKKKKSQFYSHHLITLSILPSKQKFGLTLLPRLFHLIQSSS
jgi:hypothetical protein